MNQGLEGSIVFSNNRKSNISRIIRKFTKSRWSHVFVLWRTIDEELFLIEAGELTIQAIPFSNYLTPDYELEIYKPLVSKKEIIYSWRQIIKFLGKKYGWLQLIGFGFVIIWNRLMDKLNLKKFKRRGNIFTWNNICSEIAMRYLLSMNLKVVIDLLEEKDINLISPEDIYISVIKDKDFKFVAKKEYNKPLEFYE